MKTIKNVHIINALSAVLEQNTTHYKEDFEVDKKILAEAWDKDIRTLLWMSRPNGTHLFKERDVFISDSPACNTYTFYKQQGMEKGIRAFVVVLKQEESDGLYGDIYDLEYKTHSQYVENNAVAFGYREFLYEKGVVKETRLNSFPEIIHPELGALLGVEFYPMDNDALHNVLDKERVNRTKAKETTLEHMVKKSK